MLGVIFTIGSDVVEVRVDNNNVYFRDKTSGAGFATIEGLQLSKSGVEKEFPDLKDRGDWREKAIERFKETIKLLDNEKDKMDYIIKDLKEHGYIPKIKQKQGFRPVRLS